MLKKCFYFFSWRLSKTVKCTCPPGYSGKNCMNMTKCHFLNFVTNGSGTTNIVSNTDMSCSFKIHIKSKNSSYQFHNFCQCIHLRMSSDTQVALDFDYIFHHSNMDSLSLLHIHQNLSTRNLILSKMFQRLLLDVFITYHRRRSKAFLKDILAL